MAKFDATNLKTNRVTNAITTGTSRKGQQATASPEEAEARKRQLRTQGRKGCRAERINIAITPENHQFIKVMAQITGKSMAEFTNIVIERYRTEHPEMYEDAKAIIDKL